MCDSMELKNVFYACVIPFLIFFASFALIIYPNRVFLHPHGIVDALAALLPANFAAPLSIIRNWSFAVFYVMAEMWGSVVASLLFWGFANEVTTVDEAKKYCTLQICTAFSFATFPATMHSSQLFSVLGRSIVWSWCKCCTYFFRPIRSICIQHARILSSWCRCMGSFIEVFDGCCYCIRWGITGNVQVHARQNCFKECKHVQHEKIPSEKEGEDDHERIREILIE